MKREILQQLNKIKNRITDLEDENIDHPIIDTIYEELLELEDMVYEIDESEDTEDESYD